MKTKKIMKTVKSPAVLTFVISVFAIFALFLSGCREDPLEREMSPVSSEI